MRLKDILKNESFVDKLPVVTDLDFEKSLLTFKFPNNTITISLEGQNALINQSLYPYMGQYPVSIELKAKPTLLVINDYHNQDHLYLFDRFGRVQKQIYNNDKLDLLNIYHKGFGGYTVQLEIPKNSLSLIEVKKEQLSLLKKQIRDTLDESHQLSPPLQLIADATEITHQDLGDVIVDYLYDWNESYSWLYPENKQLSDSCIASINAIDWSKIDNSIHKGSEVASAFFLQFESLLTVPIEQILTQAPWKNQRNEIHLVDVENNLMNLTQQIYKVVDQVPDNTGKSSSARKLSAYMRLYGLHYSKIAPELPIAHDVVILETPISQKIIQQESLLKLEDNKPKLTLKISNAKSTQYIPLQYDPFASGLKWSVLGDYLVRFQPQVLTLPYHIRLRDARQITYPDSIQPLSYESDLLITDLRTGKEEETTIKMNKVYETWDGYRFYMANLTPGVPTEAQKVQLVVNLDPVKYYLTYPGAIILTLGIVLLFWLQPYKKR